MLLKLQHLSSKYKSIIKVYSTKTVSKNITKYTNTINLPKTKFPTRLSQAKRIEIEKNIVENTFKNLYGYQEQHNNEPTFVLHDGPPYANGNLHMGHAVNKILKDITLRQNIVNKKKVHYKAGWDCHGLPIELKAITGKINNDPVDIRQKSRQFALDTITKQRKEFKSWGVMADWENPDNIYKTFEPKYIAEQLKIFLDFYDRKLVYRDLKPVFWSPSSRTALAEAELEYDSNFVSPSVILRMKLANLPKSINISNCNVFALIWTTTPWTLPSNQAVCYNPDFEYSIIKLDNSENEVYLIATELLEQFQQLTNLKTEILSTIPGIDLNNCSYFHPINDQEILPFIPANHVQSTKGTGLVHTAPAHGPEDFLVSLEHKIPFKCFVDEAGLYTNEAPSFLHGKCVLKDGDELVLKYLERDVIYLGKLTHSYPIDWRTKKPVIIRASEQWFINTDQLKNKAAEEISKLEIYPKVNSEANKKALLTQVQKRPYWCISRQRSWGVPIPVFYKKDSKEIIINEKIIQHISSLLIKNGNIDFWWSKDVKDLLSPQILNELHVKADDIVKGKDIFDIWFDSGISWLNALDGDKIADMYLEGFDQFTGWFQSSLLTSIAYRNCSPYKSLFVHGFTVDEKGHKMSKSLGNIISPNDITKKYGTDVLRWWVASHGTQHSSIIVSDNLLEGSVEMLSKIRSTIRYLNGVIGEKTQQINSSNNLNYLDRYLLNSLWNFEKEIFQLYKNYEYNRVAAVIQNFIANQISSVYVNLVKDRLYCGNDNDYQTVKVVLINCYEILCKTLYPIVPFLIEESWSYYDTRPFYEQNIITSDAWKDDEAELIINNVLNLRRNLNQNIKDVNTWTLNCEIMCNENDLILLKKLHSKIDESLNTSELCDLLQVSNIILRPSETNITEVKFSSNRNQLCPRCRRFSILNEDVCIRCNIILSSKNLL